MMGDFLKDLPEILHRVMSGLTFIHLTSGRRYQNGKSPSKYFSQGFLWYTQEGSNEINAPGT